MMIEPLFIAVVALFTCAYAVAIGSFVYAAGHFILRCW